MATDLVTILTDTLAHFHHLTTVYKTVSDHPILVHVLVPKDIITSSCPVFVRFHGGGLVTGSAVYPDWFSPWQLRWPLSQNAIFVAPDYRLVPEANGADLLVDLEAFWKWVGRSLQTFINTTLPGLDGEAGRVTADLDRVAVLGESAGGYFAIQSGFMADSLRASSPPVNIRGIVAAYPMIDMEDPWFTDGSYRKHEKWKGFPEFPFSVIGDHLAGMVKDKELTGHYSYVSAATPPDRTDLLVAIFQHGYWTKLLKGDNASIPDEVYPFRRLETTSTFPPVFIMHGKQDTAVAVEGSEKFTKRLKERLGGVLEVRLVLEDGDHGFDKAADHEMTEWLRDGCRWIEGFWVPVSTEQTS